MGNDLSKSGRLGRSGRSSKNKGKILYVYLLLVMSPWWILFGHKICHLILLGGC